MRGPVVGGVQAAVGLGDTEVGEQEHGRPGGHRGPAVSVDSRLPAANALLGSRGGDELLGESGGLAVGTIQPTA